MDCFVAELLAIYNIENLIQFFYNKTSCHCPAARRYLANSPDTIFFRRNLNGNSYIELRIIICKVSGL